MAEKTETKDLFAGMNARERAAAEEKAKNKKTRIKYYIVGAIVVVLALLVILVNSKAFTNGTAMKVLNNGAVEGEYSVAEMNYNYESAYMQFYNNYGSYMSYLIDPNTELSKQTCAFDDTITWAEYFLQQGEENARQNTAFYSAAKAAGYAITEEQQAEIDSAVANYEMYADAYGYTLDGYIAATFGEGNNEKTLRANMEKELICSAYLNDLYESFEYSNEELDAYYQENYDNYQDVNYIYAYFSANADEENGIDEETAKAEALSKAESIEGEDAESFTASAAEVLGSDPVTTSLSVASFLSNYATDYTKDDIKEGMKFVHDSGNGCYAIFVTGLSDDIYNTVSVRHILVKAVDEDGDGEYSEEEKQAALEGIQAIQAEWEAGEATEETFAQLATLKTEDTASAENGGLYENIAKGQMVPEFNDFCFADHQPGDTAIVYGESSSYAGYHLIYFVSGDGELYSRTVAKNDMSSKAYNEAVEALLEPYTTEHTGMWRYVKG